MKAKLKVGDLVTFHAWDAHVDVLLPTGRRGKAWSIFDNNDASIPVGSTGLIIDGPHLLGRGILWQVLVEGEILWVSDDFLELANPVHIVSLVDSGSGGW